MVMLREAELAETALRHRLNEPTGTVRCTAAVATMQFAMRNIVPDFLLHYPKVNVVAHATDQNVDIVGENYDVAIRAHSRPTAGFDPGATDADASALVAFRGVGISQCPRSAANAQRSSEPPFAVYDAHGGYSGLATSPCEQGESRSGHATDAPALE